MADENFDDSDDLDYYHDDPDQEINDKPDRKKNIVIGFCASVVLILSAIFYLPSSIGGKITINTGANKEFGVGVSVATACATSVNAEVRSSFENRGGGGSHKISQIVISQIPTTCKGKDFTIAAYDSTSLNSLNLFGSGISQIQVFNDGGLFKRCQFGYTLNSSSPTSFSITPSTTTIDASNLVKLMVKSEEHSCTHVDFYRGDTGPGGGTVIYVDETGFKCGPDWTLTGSRSGGKCYFLEVAPASWNSTAGDPTLPWCPDNVRVNGIANNCPVATISDELTMTTSSFTEIGRGYNYSKLIAAAYAGSSAAIARAYAGGGLTDWYQPNRAEFNLMSAYAKNGPTLNPTTSVFTATYACVGTVKSPHLGLTYCNVDSRGRNQTSDYGFVNERDNTRGWYGKPAIGSSESGAGKGPIGFRIRPIRAF